MVCTQRDSMKGAMCVGDNVCVRKCGRGSSTLEAKLEYFVGQACKHCGVCATWCNLCLIGVLLVLGVASSSADIYLELRDEMLHNQVPLEACCEHLLFGEWGFLDTRQWDRARDNGARAVGQRQCGRGTA